MDHHFSVDDWHGGEGRRGGNGSRQVAPTSRTIVGESGKAAVVVAVCARPHDVRCFIHELFAEVRDALACPATSAARLMA
ncbi:hypothetical protein [Paraburkholderia sp. Cpub6]|uniref:hypothetical protein n=1 Tax=Paraburkholderia sp. Cpub6 TaxID=2723094 RepID=UPI001613689B|nr:hypothetical protein [Paraburkholderia sp. Cpub6]MBB5462452.1 hypothetical protein [Paraburkholderia sp. Cpub6]